jgi:hypothetical protein
MLFCVTRASSKNFFKTSLRERNRQECSRINGKNETEADAEAVKTNSAVKAGFFGEENFSLTKKRFEDSFFSPVSLFLYLQQHPFPSLPTFFRFSLLLSLDSCLETSRDLTVHFDTGLGQCCSSYFFLLRDVDAVADSLQMLMISCCSRERRIFLFVMRRSLLRSEHHSCSSSSSPERDESECSPRRRQRTRLPKYS